MILVDASVLIDALQGHDPKVANLIQTLPISICGLTIAEVLHGARDRTHFKKLEIALSQFPYVPVDDAIWSTMADNLFALRTNGVTVPFQDVFLATAAIEKRAELWTRDKQFQLIRKVLMNLMLFQEPP